jgi:predicted phage terminase large subunit-like protein
MAKKTLLQATDPQKQFWADESKFTAFVGGIGSGKTFAGALKVLTMPSNSTGMVLAPTFPMLRTASLRAFLEIARPAGLIESFNKSDYEMVLKGNRTIYWRSADNPDRLRGPNLGWVWLDESAMMDEETWLIAIGRLRQSPGQAWMTSTPRGTRHWLYDLVKKAHVSVTTATSASNLFNPDDFVSSVSSIGSADWQRQELGGEFVEPGGTLYKRHWFQSVEQLPDGERLSVRSWDTAATSGGGDHSVGLRMHKIDGKYYVDSVIRGQWGPDELDTIQQQTAETDGQDVSIILEREPGSAGKRINQYTRLALSDYHVVEESHTGGKYQRALPSAKEAARGGIVLVKGNWITAFLDEIADFNGEKDQVDDQVDGLSLAFNYLFRKVGVSL